MRRLFFLAPVVLAACGSGSTDAAPPPHVPASPASSAAAAAPLPELPPGQLRRADVDAAVTAGVGAFLQRVELDVDHPVFLNGKFHGFRILALHDPTFWRGVDLRPGDVVTRVNGFPVERPEDAQQALDSLRVASELRVQYERNGQPRELRFSIVDK